MSLRKRSPFSVLVSVRDRYYMKNVAKVDDFYDKQPLRDNTQVVNTFEEGLSSQGSHWIAYEGVSDKQLIDLVDFLGKQKDKKMKQNITIEINYI